MVYRSNDIETSSRTQVGVLGDKVGFYVRRIEEFELYNEIHRRLPETSTLTQCLEVSPVIRHNRPTRGLR